jgi:hypothetical protein
MTFFSYFYKFQDIFFSIFIIISYGVIILSALGVLHGYPNLFIQLDLYMKIYICLFLIIRFNPIQVWIFNKKIIFTDLDRKISFTAGLIILTTTVIKEYILKFKNKIQNKIQNNQNNQKVDKN